MTHTNKSVEQVPLQGSKIEQSAAGAQ